MNHEGSIGKNKLTFTIRKYLADPSGIKKLVSYTSLKHQMFTLFKKIKANDPSVAYTYSIEKDIDKQGGYHAHGMIYYNDHENLMDQLERYIGKVKWISIDVGQVCYGMYGTIWISSLKNERKYLDYINKYEASVTYW
jgi:hypothetical protein